MKKTETSTEHQISQIHTHWSEILDAHDQSNGSTQIADAQKNVIKRYSGCIFQYLVGATRDHNIADELAQEFAFRFVRGDFRNADPAKGRFRDYLKTTLRNLVSDYYRQQKRVVGVSLEANQLWDKVDSLENPEDDFSQLWRKELISHAWTALQEMEEQKSNFFYTVLRYRAEHPQLNSPEMATAISAQIQQSVTPEWVRQKLHRARQKFAKLLIEEVKRSMPNDHPADIETELAELNLLKYMDSA